ncbi:Smyd3 [Symbiodinium sp. CCMP2456]|nr:Smyd3 [Symbiodinium sp. CCMP2456]
MMKQPEEEEEEEDKEQWGLLEKSFSGTAGQKGPDHHLEAYLNERLYNKRKEQEEPEIEKSREERLYEVPANLQVPDAAEGQADKMSWVAGLAEVALPVEYKLKNIEATEKAKREYLYGEHASAKPGAVIETDAVTRKAFGSRFMNVDRRDDSKAQNQLRTALELELVQACVGTLSPACPRRSWSQLSFSFKEGGIITSWNKRAEEVLGRKSQDVMGQAWTSLVVEGCAAEAEAAIEAVQAPGEEVSIPLMTGEDKRCCMRFVVRKFGRKSCFLFSCGHTPPTSSGVPSWPLEIRNAEGQGKSAYAVCDLPENQILLEEEPFYTRTPPAELHGRKEWDEDWSAAFTRIKAPMRLPGGDSEKEKPLLASTALVRDVLGFVKMPESLRGALLSFSFPALDLEHGLVDVALQLAKLCKERLPECKAFEVEWLQIGILVTEMNIFPGGRVFWTMSRINHSCAPNCVFTNAPGRWGLRTLRPIRKGEELTISYLGEELLLPTGQRRWLLWRSKCFICQCSRCTGSEDPLRDRACICLGRAPLSWRVVHKPAVWQRAEPSTKSRAVALLKEGFEFGSTGEIRRTSEGAWVQVEKCEVNGQTSGWGLIDGAALGLGRLIEPCEGRLPSLSPHDGVAPGELRDRLQKRALASRAGLRLNWYDGDKLERYALPAASAATQWRRDDGDDEDTDAETGAEVQGPACLPIGWARLRGENWHCRCGCITQAMAAEKELSEVAQRVFALSLPDQPRASQAGVKGLALPDEGFVLTALRLADDAGSLFGRRHWIWQWGLLFAVDLDLSLIRYTYMQWDAAFASGTAAMLIEVWDWLTSLGLSQEPSLFLHSRAQRLAKELESVTPPNHRKDDKDRFRELQGELRRRLEASSPSVSLLPPREFIPGSLFIAH